MFRRIFSFLLLVWALGFAAFAMLLPQPADDTRTDGVVVVTGAGGRIERGVEALQQGWSKKLLVSGVDSEVKPEELAAEYDIPMRLMDCCITLGYEAVDTRSNAAESATWVRQQKLKSIRLVTSDWHMRRAAHDLSLTLDSNVEVVRDAVPSEPKLSMLFLEYHKFLIGHAAQWLNLWRS
ncbi:YdcF family protein [Croceicoccus ponticola]|uniref:YdcF family protein n=1 Tax=Croceicoccus ponticola TaxID=2217664 RepID=A0A437GY07_9SPHN|nr:YdcF family protein [Croceicoccus ponticola]RVQ67538.1 YdcF family protein [Croceicoccus ponticola]